MRHIACEGRCFVLSAVQHTDKIRGGSIIANPLGQVLAGPVYGEETVLIAGPAGIPTEPARITHRTLSWSMHGFL